MSLPRYDKIRLAIVSTHPIQYHSCWYRALAERPELDMHVYYCHRSCPQEQAKAGFGVAFDWDLPLLDGYAHTFLNNVAETPGHGRFAGFDTPEIKALIKTGKLDAILINGWHYKAAWQAIYAGWQTGIKVLLRGDSHLNKTASVLTRCAKAVVYPFFVSRFDACLAAGEWSRDYFLRYGALPDRVFVVPHTIEDQYFAMTAKKLAPIRDQLRGKWSLDKNAVVLMFAGKFIGIKRPLDLIVAIERAAAQGFLVQGLLVGDGPLRRELECYVRRHRIPITFTGFLNQSQIVSAYVASDLLVLPSYEESWGLVVNEAMTCGRACIVSDRVGCAPDLVKPGQTGTIYPAGDIDALSGVVSDFAKYSSEIARMGANSRELIQQSSVHAAVERLLECLYTITGKGARYAVAQ